VADHDPGQRASAVVAAWLVASIVLLVLFAAAVGFALRRAAARDFDDQGNRLTKDQYVASRPILVKSKSMFTCVAKHSNGVAVPAASPKQVLQAQLDVLCAAGYRREPANVMQSWTVVDNGGDVHVKLCAAVIVASSSWLVDYAMTESADDPGVFAALVLGSNPFSGRRMTFAAPVVGPTAPCGVKPPRGPAAAAPTPSTAGTAVPSNSVSSAAAPTASPSPVPSGPSGTRVPPALPTVHRPRLTAVVFHGDATVLPGERVHVGFTSGPALRAGFTATRLLTVAAGDATITSVLGEAEHTVRRPASVTATPDDRYGIWEPTVALDIPSAAPGAGKTVVIRGNPHTSAFPNLLGADSLVFGVNQALAALAVVWAALARRRRLSAAAALADGARCMTAVGVTAGLAAAAAIAAGLFETVDTWSYRYRDIFGSGSHYLPMTGAQVAAVTFLAAAVPALAAAVERGAANAGEPVDASLTTAAGRAFRAVVAVLALAAVGTAVAGAVLLARGLRLTWSADLTAASVAAVVAAVVLLLWVTVTARFAASGDAAGLTRRQKQGVVVATMTVVALGAEAELAYRHHGYLVTALVAVVPTAAVALAAFMSLRVVAASYPAWRAPLHLVGTGASAPRRVWQILVAGIVAIALALPGPQPMQAFATRVTWSGGFSGAFTTATLLNLALVTVIALAVRRAGRGTTSRTSLQTVRVLAGSMAVVLWAPSQSWWFLPVGFAAGVVLVRWWLLPTNQLVKADVLRTVSQSEQNESIAAAADAIAMTKAVDSQLDDALASKGKSLDEIRAITASLRARRAQIAAGLAEFDAAARFGHVAEMSAWRRGVIGARASTLLALPWIVLAIRADANQVLSSGYHYRIGQFLTALPFDVLWWSGIGFVLGWAYPMIRGANGLQKASTLLATIAVPILTTVLFPGPATHHRLVTSIQIVAETASVLLIIGLLADYLLLKRAGFGYRKLVEMRRLSAIVTWVTSLTVAIGAALTSLIVAGVTGALTYLSTPNVQHGNGGTTGTTQTGK
jgi:hypothetical protein